LIANWRQGTEIVRTRSRERLCKKGKGQWGNEEKREEKEKNTNDLNKITKKITKLTEKRYDHHFYKTDCSIAKIVTIYCFQEYKIKSMMLTCS